MFQQPAEIYSLTTCCICYLARIASYSRVPHYVYVIFELVWSETDLFPCKSFPLACATDIPLWYEEIKLNRAPFRSQRHSNWTLLNDLVASSVGNILSIAKIDDLHDL